ncbi:aldehyde dehydrogenase family protein [Spongiibacter sp. UBA1325]|jgi:p-cumic aldehyde dehydrogenase|uniref:aldehyde dehydrogenase family protein n=1 Tax=Spongiibacter sp. UBA1325 TaxID=1947543 RepID=UPI00257AB0AE|nr:aldehyde dehydrogenase family protein [Spongiibacter sp. UBA1325]|tara:strand:+ start:3061 stop:4533 length:1473 start_codon:yes stop_codon:yes gene_type:complete
MNSLSDIQLPSGKMLIGEDWLDSLSGETLPVENPATGEVFAQVAAGGAEDIDRAVKVARAAFESPVWAKMRPIDRSRLLEQVALKLEAHAEELALIDSFDNGKPKHLAMMVDVPSAVEVFRYMAGWCTKIYGKTLPVSGDGRQYHAYTLRQPVGVIGQIVPWNYPLPMAAWKIASALAAGCTVVLKPSEVTSLSTLRMAELILEAGVPPGVVNIVTGFGEKAGEALITHPGIDKIAFTGSTNVGKHILRSSANDLRRVSLELGGKSPTIIMPDADLEKAIPDAAMAIFFNSGQTCFAGSRLLCHESIYDTVVAGINEVAKNLPIGPGQDPATMIGPVVNKKQRDRIQSYIDIGQQEGAEAISPDVPLPEQGYFVRPTILSGATSESRVFNEEIFGPVLAATKFSTEEEAIRLANSSCYGLGANLYCKDMKTSHRMAATLQAGTVWINTYFVVDAAMPFGGFKESGIGREVGDEGVLMYTESKSVCALLED